MREFSVRPRVRFGWEADASVPPRFPASFYNANLKNRRGAYTQRLVDYGEPPLVVNVSANGAECRVAVARPSNTQPAVFAKVHQDQLLAIARSEKTRRAIVVSDLNAAYKCIGAAIITVQQAGKMVDLATWDSR